MTNFISNLAKKNILVTLLDGKTLDVIASDEAWNDGLADYLEKNKQQLIAELATVATAATELPIQARNLPAEQEEVKNTEHENPATTAAAATTGINSASPFATSLRQVATQYPVGVSGIADNNRSNLQQWIERVRQAQSQIEIFDILARFQPLDWTDAERAVMSHAYIHRLEVLEALPEVGRLMSRHLKPGSKA